MPKTMSEKTRAFLALKGEVYPRVGDRGIFQHFGSSIDAEFSDDDERTVEVVRVSATGLTIWIRFIHPEGQRRFGAAVFRVIRSPFGQYYTSRATPTGDLIFR